MKVFLCETIHTKAFELLKQKAEIIGRWDRIGDADALISRTVEIGRAEMECMPGLKVIAIHGTGTDAIDLEEAKRRGIRVVCAPHMNANAVAELNVGLILAVCRGIVRARQMIDAGEQGQVLQQLKGIELRGRTAGFVGLGAIASRTAEILGRGFGMETAAYTPSLTPERAKRCGCKCAKSLEDLLSGSDIVCLATSLNDGSRGLIDGRRLAIMRSGAVLINTARGALVDENALYEALKSGRLGGAASDVFCSEPVKKENPLLSLPNFVATPHMGANTDEALYVVGMACVQQILDVMAGKEPQYPVC